MASDGQTDGQGARHAAHQRCAPRAWGRFHVKKRMVLFALYAPAAQSRTASCISCQAALNPVQAGTDAVQALLQAVKLGVDVRGFPLKAQQPRLIDPKRLG